MKQVFAATLLFASISSMAVSPSDIEPPEFYGNTFVSDTADVLSLQNEQQLDDYLVDYYEATGNQVAVITTQDTQGSDSPRSFANALFDTFEFGDADLDNGLLILLSMDDRRIEFETGYGLEGLLPDVVQYRIQQEHMIPLFKAGDYENGLIEGTYAVVNELDAASEAEAAYQAQNTTAQTAYNPASAKPTTNNDNFPFGFNSLLLLLFGAITAVFLCVIYRVVSSSRPSRVLSDDKPLQPTPTPQTPKRPCLLCKESLPATLVAKPLPASRASSYVRKLLTLDLISAKSLECPSCGYDNQQLVFTKRMHRCGECKHVTRYLLDTITFNLGNYFTVYKDEQDRTLSLKNKVFKTVQSGWQAKEVANLYLFHCYLCDDLEGEIRFIALPQIPVKYVPKPSVKTPTHTKAVKPSSVTSKRASSSSSSSWRSLSKSSGSSSSRSSSSRSKPKPRSRGGRSGGGGAGSSW